MSKEHILEEYIDGIRDRYDYIIIDCNPGVDNLILNALTCCDSVLIPSPPEYLCVEGLQEIIRTIGQVKKRLNRKIEIEGVLLTIVNGRTNIARDIMNKMEEAYGQHLKIFQTVIPESVKAKEAVANGISVYEQSPKSSVAVAYEAFVEEVLDNE
jgi:chromosome partitioning protein